MAPSPTGPLHIGTARTALFNWLFARKHGGVFVLRIEDTDRERSKKEYEQEILDGFAWLGIDWDEFARQSERLAVYRSYLERLLKSGDAYYCYCTKEDLEAQRQAMLASGLPPRYNGHCRPSRPGFRPPEGREPQVIRFKVPETTVEFRDVIRGKVSFDASLLGDQVIAKNLDAPLYNFAVVVDDALMEITHVIRGEDHVSNTPKQIVIQRALGFREPLYAHIPLILNSDRSKMSKRFADTALAQYRERGYLPGAMVNFLALLGWHPKDDREVMDPAELIELFELERVQKSGAVFNEDKLKWLNREQMKKLDVRALAELVRPFLPESVRATEKYAALVDRIVSVERQRAETLADFATLGKFFFELPAYEPKLLIWKESPLREVKQILEELIAAIDAVGEQSFDRETITAAVAAVINGGGSKSDEAVSAPRNRGSVLWPLRVSLSGQASSPDPIEIMLVLGKDESLSRIRRGIGKLS